MVVAMFLRTKWDQWNGGRIFSTACNDDDYGSNMAVKHKVYTTINLYVIDIDEMRGNIRNRDCFQGRNSSSIGTVCHTMGEHTKHEAIADWLLFYSNSKHHCVFNNEFDIRNTRITWNDPHGGSKRRRLRHGEEGGFSQEAMMKLFMCVYLYMHFCPPLLLKTDRQNSAKSLLTIHCI